jgi:DNA-directed RNA polymerase specialized sigma24 family protein
VIVLAYDGELSQSEIAPSLGWPIGTVKTRIGRALRHLRDGLRQCEFGGRGLVPFPTRVGRGLMLSSPA